jgi:hypothetical protein
MAATLRVDRPNGTTIAYLPDHSNLSVQIEHNNVGSISFNYLANGYRADVLDNDDALIYVVDEGVVRDDVYLLEDDGDDPADAAGDARNITVSGRGVMAILERALVYPRAHKPGEGVVGLDPYFPFVEPGQDDGQGEPPAVPTPGRIMNVLIARAKARNAIPQITTDFDQDRDSNGDLWPEDYSVRFDAGVNLLSVLQGMCEQGWCDARMKGLTLQMFAPDNRLNRNKPNIILRRGREVMSGPRQRSRRTIKSVMYAVGEEGAATHAENPEARARYGRREGFLGQGGMTALDVLGRVADKSLAAVSKQAEGFTVQCDLSVTEGPKPFIDYEVGDRIRYDQRRLNETEYEPMRVRTMTTAWDQFGNKTVSLELNDLFVERSVRLARKIDGILNGSSNNSRPPVRPDPDDNENERITPRAPASVSVSSGAVTKNNGSVVAAATVAWPKVYYNKDASVFDDFGFYAVQMQFPNRRADEWSGSVQVHDNDNDPLVAYFQDLPPGERVKFRVRAADFHGNKSEWTESAVHTLATDATPPPGPGKPTAEVLIGGVRIGWNGLGQFGEPMPVDFAHCIVHMSTSGPGFDVSDDTKAATLRTRGFVTIAPLDTTLTYYFRLQTVDRNGNVSLPSPTIEAKPRRVISADLAEKIITLGALADLERASVTTTFLATFESQDDRWERRSGSGELTHVASPTAATGGGVGAFTLGAAGLFEFNQNVPYDPEQLYRVQARVRPTAGASGFVSIGVTGIAYDGITHVSAANTSTGDDHFVAAYNRPPGAVNEWVTVTGFLRGHAAGASSPAAAPNPTRVPAKPIDGPRELAASAKYIRPVIKVSGGSTAWQVDQVTIEMLELPPNIIGTIQIADATIVAAKIGDAQIDDAHIGNLTVTSLRSGNFMADAILVNGAIRTSASTTGRRLVLDALGLRAWDGDGLSFIASSTGDITARGELQTGRDAGAHVSIKAQNETVNGNPLDPVDRVPSMRLYTGVATESQPAVVRSDWTDTGGGVFQPVMAIRSGQRGTSPRARLMITGAAPSRASSVKIAAGSLELVSEESGKNVQFYIRNVSSTANGAAPLQIGAEGGQRLLLSRDEIKAVDSDGTDGTLFINNNLGPVSLANRLIVRHSPNSGTRAQLIPTNTEHTATIVFAPNAIHVRNRTDVSYQPIMVSDIVQSNPGSAGGAARALGPLGASSRRRGATPEPSATEQIVAMQVNDYDQPGKRPPIRSVDPSGVPEIVQDGDPDNPSGVKIGALVATLVAAQQELVARIATLEEALAAPDPEETP